VGGLAGGLAFWALSGELGGLAVGLVLGLVGCLAVRSGGTGLRGILLGSRGHGPEPCRSSFRWHGALSRLGDSFMHGVGEALVFSVPVGLVIMFVAWNVFVLIAIVALGAVLGGLTRGLVGAFEAPIDIDSAVSPTSVRRADRRHAVLQVTVIGLIIWTVFAAVTARSEGLSSATIAGLFFALLVGPLVGLGRNAWTRWLVLVRLWLPGTGRLPWRVAAFLDDAYVRGVLRQTGAVYQFRHARIQHHLARPPVHHTAESPATARVAGLSGDESATRPVTG
jgi:hypothetical protein